MKKILYILLIGIMLCGCRSNNNNHNNNFVEQMTKEQILLDYVRKIEKESPLEMSLENLGPHFTPINIMNLDSSNIKLFKNCNDYGTGVDITIFQFNGELRKQYKLYLYCDDKLTTYYYDSIEENAKPIDITVKNNFQ